MKGLTKGIKMKHLKTRNNPMKKNVKNNLFILGSLGIATTLGLYLVLRPKSASAAKASAKDSKEPKNLGPRGEAEASPTSSSSSKRETPTPPVRPGSDLSFDGYTFLNYPVNLTPGSVEISKPYPDSDSPLLTVSFPVAPALGLSENPSQIAGQIATKMRSGSTAEYKPTSDEIRMLAYILCKERPSTGGRITEVEAQRERASMLWCVANRIEKSGKSIKNTISSTSFVGYYQDFDDKTKMDNVIAEHPEFKAFVKAFFKGYFPQEAVDTTSWVHAGHKYVKRWRAWTLPAGTLDQNGNVITGTSFSQPYYIGEAVFSRGIAL